MNKNNATSVIVIFYPLSPNELSFILFSPTSIPDPLPDVSTVNDADSQKETDLSPFPEVGIMLFLNLSEF